MTIKNLMKLIELHAPEAVIRKSITQYSGKIIAIDANHFLYQYIIAIRNNGTDLIDRYGNVVSHLHAIFYRTIGFLELGIKPVYVFDGTPPELKKRVIQDRKKSKKKAEKQMECLKNTANNPKTEPDKNCPEYIKHFKRCVYITKQQIDECQYLLRIMGIPFVQAIGEADAQCASMARSACVWGVSTEDMDILTFNSPYLLRGMSTSKAKKDKEVVIEINFDVVLEKLGLNRDQFIDLCILLGCDYCPTIKGIGYNSAYPELQKYGTLDNLVEHIKANSENSKYKIPENFEEISRTAKNCFLKPEIIDPKDLDLKTKRPMKNKLVEFLCDQHSFDRKVIANKIKFLKELYENEK